MGKGENKSDCCCADDPDSHHTMEVWRVIGANFVANPISNDTASIFRSLTDNNWLIELVTE